MILLPFLPQTGLEPLSDFGVLLFFLKKCGLWFIGSSFVVRKKLVPFLFVVVVLH